MLDITFSSLPGSPTWGPFLPNFDLCILLISLPSMTNGVLIIATLCGLFTSKDSRTFIGLSKYCSAEFEYKEKLSPISVSFKNL